MSLRGSRQEGGLYRALKALPWRQVGVHASSTTLRGRRITRTDAVCEVPVGLDFPHIGQVVRVHRTVTVTGKKTVEIAYLIGDLDMVDARPATIAGCVRGHWGIENKIHYVRDVTFGERSPESEPSDVRRAGPVPPVLRGPRQVS
ncbi:hypothetical protein BJF84_17160 [Rhodococcus sp. CUA-806]|nr:hypothetical protein BJF84_17160 [Rhodococcus sp. CUA-806]